MRNQWYPQQLAEYATASKLEALGVKEDDIIQLDNISRSKILEDERESRKAAKADAKALMKANIEAKGPVAEPAWEPPVEPVELELLSVRCLILWKRTTTNTHPAHPSNPNSSQRPPTEP